MSQATPPKPSPPEWISVKERLPEVGWVLTHEKMTSGSVRARWFGANGKFVEPRTSEEGGDEDCTYFVTHWMPLPNPPRAGLAAETPHEIWCASVPREFDYVRGIGPFPCDCRPTNKQPVAAETAPKE